jgi:hypothetical protein
MRLMIATMLLPLLALVGVEVFTRTANVSATPVATTGPKSQGVCRIDGTGRLRLFDGDAERVLAEPYQIAAACAGGLAAYAVLLPVGLDLLVCSEAGNVLHRVQLPAAEVDAATAASQVRLVSSTRAFVVLHVNPSTEMGLLIDFRTGERKVYQGHHFAPSPDGRDVAYFREPPHFGPAERGETAAVFVNDRKLASIPRNSGLSFRWREGRTVTANVQSWNGTEEAYELKPF